MFCGDRLAPRLSQGLVDVLVVGGGLEAARVALDLASRGLEVGVLDSGGGGEGGVGRLVQGTLTLEWWVGGRRWRRWCQGPGCALSGQGEEAGGSGELCPGC